MILYTVETPTAAEEREKTQYSPSCPLTDLRHYVMCFLSLKCATKFCNPQLPVQLLFYTNRQIQSVYPMFILCLSYPYPYPILLLPATDLLH